MKAHLCKNFVNFF